MARRRKRVDRRHFPAVLDLNDVGAIMTRAERVDTCTGLNRAHQLLTFCVQGVGEIVGAHRSEFDIQHGSRAVATGVGVVENSGEGVNSRAWRVAVPPTSDRETNRGLRFLPSHFVATNELWCRLVRTNSFGDDMDRLLYRVREFCTAHAISPVTFYKLLADGQGPRITRIGGGTFVSTDDAAEWRKTMAEATDQAKLRARPTGPIHTRGQ